MKKACTLILICIGAIVSFNTLAQSAGDYRSNVFIGGNWSAAANWQRFDGASWVAAPSAPSASDGVITILAGDLIEITAATVIDQVVIESTGQLSIYNLVTPFVCTLSNGAGTDIINSGTLVVSANATLSGAGDIVNNAGASFTTSFNTILTVSATNNGTMMSDAGATYSSNTVINNASFILQNSTLNLNNATLINHGVITFPSLADSNISSTGGGVFTNDIDGTLFKNSALGIARIDPTPGTLTFTNFGVVKGTGEFVMRSTATNTGAITPGDNGAGILIVNPAFVTGKSPKFNLDIVSTGAAAGITYDRASFSAVDVSTVNISNSTLTMTDAGSDAVLTVYTIFTSASTINGTFASVNLPPTLGNLTYNATTITVQKIASVNRYTWIGGSTGSWSTSTNWSPLRVTPAASDVLNFGTGTTVTLTNVPTETIGMLNITNNTTVNLQASTLSKTLTIGNGSGFYLNVDPGSTLNSLTNGSVVLNVSVNTGSKAVVGGVVNMQNGTFDVGNNTLVLHTTANPLTRASGQFNIGTTGSLEFGDLTHTAGPTITLSNTIFVAPPSINRITVCRTNGAAFGNQDITVNQAFLTLGNLTTNGLAHIRFSQTATNPVETAVSKIIGYADMVARPVGTTALDFLGVSLAAGSDVGSVSINRVTGPNGVNTFNGKTSIAETWALTASFQPSPARNISFSWLSDFDNNVNTALQFQDYRFDAGPGWTAVGSLAVLASVGNPRLTTPAATVKLTGSWTIADQLNALPITLDSFEGEQVDNKVLLNWKTLSEINGDYFEIQRRHEREEGFTILGTVSAHGTTNKIHQYNFTDEQAVAGINYYRLRLVDFDQSFDYSSMIRVDYKPEADFSIYPNPNTGKTVTLVFSELADGIINIFDTRERKILTRPVSESATSITFTDLQLSEGMYLIIFDSGGKRISKKLLVTP